MGSNRIASHLPAAKCNGVDLRPAVSLAFTVCGVISFFTLAISPVLQASKSSLSGSLAMTASRLTLKMARLRLLLAIVVLVCYALAHTRPEKNRQQKTSAIFSGLSGFPLPVQFSPPAVALPVLHKPRRCPSLACPHPVSRCPACTAGATICHWLPRDQPSFLLNI